MSLETYKISKALEMEDVPFYALIMAAMRRADTENQAKLRSAWPAVWEELVARYRAPGGLLPNENLAEASSEEAGEG